MPATRTRTTRALARSAAATPSPVKVKVKAEDILPKLEEQSTSLQSPQKTKKLKLVADYTSSSPFPEWKHPTPEEARAVHGVLSQSHPEYASSKKITPDEANNAAQTCGRVPNVLESLIGTILSQNTSCRNSTAAKASLDKNFGRNDFASIAAAPRADLVKALKMGGLANKKAAVIQSLLGEVKERHGDYSLQYLSSLPDDEVMSELVSYNGVGPKTASCVLLFCLGRDSFAVDTHVYRLSRLLGWVPPRADRVMAQAHLDKTIPDALKYDLHVLMVRHGRQCAGCKNAAGKGKSCPLKSWLRERGVKGEDVEEGLIKADEDAQELPQLQISKEDLDQEMAQLPGKVEDDCSRSL